MTEINKDVTRDKTKIQVGFHFTLLKMQNHKKKKTSTELYSVICINHIQ